MYKDYFNYFLASICLSTFLLLASSNPVSPAFGREGYFNGSSYIRLHTALSLKHHIGLNFRSCHGGELFSQHTNGNTVLLEVSSVGLLFSVTIPQRSGPDAVYKSKLSADLLDNRWHTVNIVHRLGNLTMSAAGHQQVVANSTYHSEIFTAELSSPSSVLIVGNSFKGCILDGPGIIFNDSLNSAHSIQWGQCPLNTNSCTKLDYCYNAPCFKGTCISRENRYECHCTSRYSGKNCDKDNGPVCEKQPCENNGVCTEDAVGNYHCQCGPGHTGQRCETELSSHVCEKNPCHNNGSCRVATSGPGRYECNCQPGYEGENCERNKNECQPNPCQNGGLCIDGINNYTCQCGRTGYQGNNCEINIDECVHNPCLNQGRCFDTYGSYTCECIAGYGGSNCELNLDECQSSPCLNNGICDDLIGSYKCTCHLGFAGNNCEQNVDDCVGITCPSHSECIDGINSYKCMCKPGFLGISPDCIEASSCKSVQCFNGGTCNELDGYYNCSCAPGFTGKLCLTHIAECESAPCLNGGSCIDLVNGYACNCTADYMGENCEREMDVCALLPCHHGGTCKAKNGRREYECECVPGYDGQHCEININDCDNNPCPSDTTCIDGVNTYECRCHNGMTGEDCSVHADYCHPSLCQNNATCREEGGRPVCECTPGFRGDNCELDIDECAETSKLCNNGICQNKAGSYTCYCIPGFSGDNCDLDFNECLSNPCLNEATCINKINSFECVCRPGYTGKVCNVDIDECESNPCSVGATCLNEINAFTCVCPPGLTGKRCETNIDECASSPCQNDGLCIDQINAYMCNCTGTGFEGVHCEENINDCLDAICTNGGTCKDKINHYECDCYPGYTGKNCEVDINECESSPCQNGGSCLQHSNTSLYHIMDEEYDNTYMSVPLAFRQEFEYGNASGYECVCVPGVQGVNCEININECESNPCVSGTCLDKIGSFVCECGEGFEGLLCEVDIDECLQNPCVNGTCTDKRADYSCECLPGYGGKNCSVKLIGCDNGKCLNNGTCVPYLQGETEHMFNCSCKNGFHGPVCGKVTTMSMNGSAHVMANVTREEGYDIQFRFRTTLPSGLIALGIGSTYYKLELVDGRLNLHSSLLNKWDGVFIGSKLNDSKWHKVFVAINASHVVLAANEEQTIYPINTNQQDMLNLSQASHTSFPTTYLGGVPKPSLVPLGGKVPYIGCLEDVIVNNKWIIPDDLNDPEISMVNIGMGCPREEQCNPNPCHNSGGCTDKWSNFACACERPFLGHMCQYNVTAATFGNENITDSLVTVRVDDAVRRAVSNIVDISMFVRTREERGFIFYMGAAEQTADATFITAQLEGGELLVKIQFNGTPEAYTVGGLKLSDGGNYLIQVVRNVTLIQVKINGTEYFRKTISATGPLDVQVLYLGGFPMQTRVKRDAVEVNSPTSPQLQRGVTAAPNFKGIIQDVQVTNGKQLMVVEFFPLHVEGLSIPARVGEVSFDSDSVKMGVVSDDACLVAPCSHDATCSLSWNDFVCECPRGYKGKTCNEMEFCQLQDCPKGSSCRNLDHGYECVANMTFDGVNSTLDFSLNVNEMDQKTPMLLDSIEINYRSQTGGTILYVSHELEGEYLSVSVFRDQVTVAWKLDNTTVGQLQRFRKEPDGNWTTIILTMKEGKMQGGFKGATDSPQSFVVENFPLRPWLKLINGGKVILGSGMALKGLTDLTLSQPNEYSVMDRGEVHMGEGVTVNPMDGNDVDMQVATLPTDAPVASLTGAFFKGCLGEVRIGGLLLPYFTPQQLQPSSTDNTNNNTDADYFLLSNSLDHIGCMLCFEKECQNEGTCLDPEESYSCKCQPGFRSDDCSINIDECKKNECHNGAACKDGIANYTCECPLGWNGWLCDMDIDECASNPCLHNGSCNDLLGSFKCDCTEEYMGTYCEFKRPITCENHPCRQGSTCVDLDEPTPNKKDNYTCTCMQGYQGDNCETAYCELNPCQNDGECDKTQITASCLCPPGYTGQFCEVDIDECADTPCMNKGLCSNKVNAFECDCRNTGWEGPQCEQDVNECDLEETVCGQGTCENTPGFYRCICEDKICGATCQFTDPCSQDPPCQNGGICTPNCDQRSDYTCQCTAGWTGENCSAEIQSQGSNAIDVAIIVAPIVGALILIGAISISFFVSMARKKRATRGTYSPSSQEYCNPRVEMDNVMKPPPEERLI